MKIGHLEPKLPTAPASERKPAPALPQPGAEPGASVDLSASAALKAGVTAEPTFDSAKVDRIAQAIRDGKFQVNAGAIADKLIDNAQELLGRAPR